MEKVKHIILVLSGKGGVGKSTISTEISLALADKGLKVGLLDIDICGPSIPYMLGLQEKSVYQNESGWIPIYMKDKNLSVMSVAFLLKDKNDAVIWRGPKKTAMINQFINDVYWDELDYLIIDTPPGTSDEHLAAMENLKNISSIKSAIIITTPQQISTDDVRKEVTFCKKLKLNILGIVENMKGYSCPHCNNTTNIFSTGGGEKLAAHTNLSFLGSFSFEPKIDRSTQLKQPENISVMENIVRKILN